MLLGKYTRQQSVKGISVEEEKQILSFIQGCVYCWCKNRKNEWFSIRDIMGGDNYFWDGTPLQLLYQKHIKSGKTSTAAITHAGRDAGWMLKKVTHLDKRSFETKKEDMVRKYRWK